MLYFIIYSFIFIIPSWASDYVGKNEIASETDARQGVVNSSLSPGSSQSLSEQVMSIEKADLDKRMSTLLDHHEFYNFVCGSQTVKDTVRDDKDFLVYSVYFDLVQAYFNLYTWQLNHTIMTTSEISSVDQEIAIGIPHGLSPYIQTFYRLLPEAYRLYMDAMLGAPTSKRAKFEMSAAAGCRSAQSELNLSAYYGLLGFDETSGRAYLEGRAAAGDQDAQNWLIFAISYGRKVSEKAYLEGRAAVGDQYAQKCLNEAAWRSKLGFDKTSGRAYLEARAVAEDQYAQNLLNFSAVWGEVSGKAYLEERIAKGDQDAQNKLNEAAYEGTFGASTGCKVGFNDSSGRKYLEGRAAVGDQDAQNKLNKAAYYGGLGFNEVSGTKYLIARVMVDDNAESLLLCGERSLGLAYWQKNTLSLSLKLIKELDNARRNNTLRMLLEPKSSTPTAAVSSGTCL